jgi:transposase
MNRFILTAEEKSHLDELHHQTKDGKERDRIKAILLRSEGWTVPMISQALRLHQTTIIRHINEYHDGKLKNESGGSDSKLDESQTKEFIAHFEAHTYHHVYEIILFIKDKWGISFSITGLNKWLYRHALSYKKPKGFPHKANPKLQEEFIAEYVKLKDEVGRDAPILFMDAVHPTQATKLSYGCIRTGQTKHVENTGSPTRLNIVGAIQLGNIAETVTAQYETIHGESIIDFMTKLRGQYGSKTVHLILDRPGYHRSMLVAKKAIELNIKLHFLPPYSPNLNPIERLWKVMNEKVRNNRFFKRSKDFKEAINRFFDDILPDIGHELDARINDNFELLKS